MGESGYSGYSGYLGESGVSGFSGISGFSGPAGGLSGYSGVSGYSGDSGVIGWSGYSGDSGVSGWSGYSGRSGFSGAAGITGASGYSGRSGFSGATGITGASGYSGRSGFSGNPAVGPKSYSINYNSYNQSLMAPTSTNLILGTGNFTIEGWVYRTGLNSLDSTAWLMLVDFRPTVPSTNVQLAVRGTDARVIFSVNETIRITSTSQINLSTWYHIALVRSSGVTKLYINGVQQGGNYTDTNNYSNNYCTIGSRYAPVSTDYRSWVGNISNFRVVKGTAVYTSNFTPTTDPLTAIAGTSLLICNQNTISGVTATGNVLVTTSNPYGTAQLSGFSGHSGNNGLSGYSGTISSTPTFATVNTTTLNTQNLNFTGAGPVVISSSNDIQLNATGWVTFTTLPRLPNKTLSQLNALVDVPIGAVAICTDASGGAKPVWYNGTLWRDMNNGSI